MLRGPQPALYSIRIYTDILGRQPVESSPNFVMFALGSGVMLGLWARHDVQPSVGAPAGAAELAIVLANREAVEIAHAEWSARGRVIVQEPTLMDFGYTFTALDPDCHRLRVFAPAARDRDSRR
jgi:hypothetical protein